MEKFNYLFCIATLRPVFNLEIESHLVRLTRILQDARSCPKREDKPVLISLKWNKVEIRDHNYSGFKVHMKYN